jgi:hypothetical protein
MRRTNSPQEETNIGRLIPTMRKTIEIALKRCNECYQRLTSKYPGRYCFKNIRFWEISDVTSYIRIYFSIRIDYVLLPNCYLFVLLTPGPPRAYSLTMELILFIFLRCCDVKSRYWSHLHNSEGNYIFGRAVTHVINRRLPTAVARVRSCGICGGQSGTGTGFFSEYFDFPC